MAKSKVKSGGLSESELKVIYNDLRKHPNDRWSEVFKKKTSPDKGISLTELHTVAVFGKIANATSFGEFQTFAKTGDVPPIKLSNSEMQILNGGYNWYGLGQAIQLAGYVVTALL